MPYLRPSKIIAQSGFAVPKSIFSNILENVENCTIGTYIIEKQGNTAFVKRGNKTELGIHVETCEICNGTAPSQSPVTQIHNIITKDDSSEKDAIIRKLMQEIENLKERYETLKAIKINSASPILFPHQKKMTRESMQAIKVRHLEELLKQDELEIARLKTRIAELEKGER